MLIEQSKPEIDDFSMTCTVLQKAISLFLGLLLHLGGNTLLDTLNSLLP